MKGLEFLILGLLIINMYACKNKTGNAEQAAEQRIIFLHHSTGHNIWQGDKSGLKSRFNKKSAVENWFNEYNGSHGTNFQIEEMIFPKSDPYGWNNFPFDYYNIWVKNAGNESYLEEPTLEILTGDHDLIVWKHCFPVGNILEDTGQPDIDSQDKRLENYKLQYAALKKKMKEFPDTRFLVWTGAALLEENTSREEALRTREFFDWVKTGWNDPGDNIYIWDFYQLETEDAPYLKKEFSVGPGDDHPNNTFAGRVNALLCNRIVDVLETGGSKTSLTGEPLLNR